MNSFLPPSPTGHAARPTQVPAWTGLQLREPWRGRVVGGYAWLRAPGTAADAAQFFLGTFVPQPIDATGVEAAAPNLALHSFEPNDRAHLAMLRLIAHGTPAHHTDPLGPFELEHSVAKRVCSINGHLVPPGVRVSVRSGDEVQLGMIALTLVAPGPEAGLDTADEMSLAAASGNSAGFEDGPIEIHDALSTTSADRTVAHDTDPQAQPSAAPALDVLGELHRRYHAMLVDPAVLGEASRWGRDGTAGERQAYVSDPIDALASRAQEQGSLFDLLSAQDTMDALIARADGIGEGSLLDGEPVESVLHLFAPTRSRPRANGIDDVWLGKPVPLRAGPSTATSAAAQTSLAGVTRREHHLAAADSALRLADEGRDGRDADDDR